LLAEPSRTNYDLHFTLFGVPVRVHPLFWLATALLSLRGDMQSIRKENVLLWVVSVFVSIMVHEFGHAFAFRHFHCQPRVVLYWLGGLAIPEMSYATHPPEGRRLILIAAAGPAAGFLLAGLVAAVLFATGYQVDFFGFPIGRGQYVPHQNLYELAAMLLQINLFWSLVNLLPVFPLDGGQISRELLTMRFETEGTARSLKVSLVVAIVASVSFLWWLDFRDGLLPAVLFGTLAYSSYVALKQFGDYGGGGYGGGGYGGGGYGGGSDDWRGGRGW
jgi:stage IV sporulation protein FB